jgi:4-amino-4-deoxy-L-arabinose transferase-like glycosyltransferase
LISRFIEKSKLKYKPLHFIIGIILGGFAFRLFLVRYRFAAAFDEVNYLKLGISGSLNGLSDVFHTYWSPLLPMFISIFCTFFEDYVFAGRFVSIMAGSLLAVPVYLLGKHVYDETVGLVAAAFVAFFPPLAFQSTQVLTEPLGMLLAAFAVYLGLKCLDHDSIRNILITAILAGLLFLNHPVGMGFFVVIAGWLLFLFLSRRSFKNLVPVMLFVVGFMVVASPYVIYLKKETGIWTPSTKLAANQQFESYESVDGFDPFRSLDEKNQSVPFDQIYHIGTFIRDSDGSQSSLSTFRIGSFLKKYMKNLYGMLKRSIPEFLTTIPMLFLGVGLLGVSWKAQQGEKMLYLLSFVVFYWFLLMPSFHIIERYLTPLWSICAIWIANGAVQIQKTMSANEPLKRLLSTRKSNVGVVAAMITFAVLLVFSFMPELSRIFSKEAFSKDYWSPPVEQKIAGLWLRDQTADRKVIMSRYQTVDIYAGNYDIRESITIPDNDLDRVLAYAQYRGVNYLVLNERYKEDNPQISHLYDPKENPDGLERIYSKRDDSGYLTAIFRIN